MRTIFNLLLALVLCTAASYAGSPTKVPIKVLSTNNEMFRFKADEKYLGAIIEIYSSSNVLTGKEFVFDRKMVIDFYYLPADTYSIKIKKGDELLEFQFI